MGSSQQFSLRWNNYLKHITCAFDTLRTEEDLVDVTLSCEGKRIRAHKMLLSACSTYFRDLFKENPCQHPVIIFRNVKFDDLAALVDFMYQGEVNVVQEQLASFLTTAELLAVQGLTDGTGKDNDSLGEDDIELPNEPEIQLQNASSKSTSDNKRNKSPSSPMPYHVSDLQPDVPPSKRRKCRENANTTADKIVGNALASKDSENKSSENQTTPGSDPVEIIPLMPNLKLEMPEYLVQDGSSCSYEEQSLGDSSLNKIGIDDTSSNTPDHDQKPDISQTFYSSSQSTSDNLDLKHQSADVGHLLSKPSTSGERLTQEAVQECEIMPREYVKRTKRSLISEEQILAAKKLIDKGKSKRFAADFVGISEATLRHRLKLNYEVRTIGFSKAEVDKFYKNLKDLYDKYKFQPHRIYNMDETGMSTVPKKTPKVVACKGKEVVGKIVSAERGMTITAVMCMSATGYFVPPALIFPRKRPTAELLDGAPSESICMVSNSGSISTTLFVNWLHHFKDFVHPSQEDPVLLIFDNHSSHISLEASNYAREHHIVMLTIPPHGSHKIQPLDVTVHSPLKTKYSIECERWMNQHPGQSITQYQVAGLFNNAYKDVATIANAESGFKVTGIYPYADHLFDETDFAPSTVTDQDPQNDTGEISSGPTTPNDGFVDATGGCNSIIKSEEDLDDFTEDLNQ